MHPMMDISISLYSISYKKYKLNSFILRIFTYLNLKLLTLLLTEEEKRSYSNNRGGYKWKRRKVIVV